MKTRATYCINPLAIGLLAFMSTGLAWTLKSHAEEQKQIDPVGVYLLAEVNGNPVPTTVSHGGNLYIISGTFTINADKTCRSKILLRIPSGEEITKEVEATYTLTGSKLLMKWKGAGWTEGTLEGNSFTMNNEGMVFKYIRRQTRIQGSRIKRIRRVQHETVDGGFGVVTGEFGFNIAGHDSELVKIETCTNLVAGVWSQITTTNLTAGSVYFSDPDWINHDSMYYRLSMP